MSSTKQDENLRNLLSTLGIAICAELESWEAHLTRVQKQPTYASLLEKDKKDLSTQIQISFHLLSTLPTRHAMLAASWDDRAMEIAPLSETCSSLLKELEGPMSKGAATSSTTTPIPSEGQGEDQCKGQGDGEPEQQRESSEQQQTKNPALSFRRMPAGKKFKAKVLKLEEGLSEGERDRLQDLRILRALHMGLMEVQADGELYSEDIETLMDAMEELGVLLSGIVQL